MADQNPTRPHRIAQFEILQEIGRGGMGVVYRACDLALNREVALKTVRATDDEQLVERFAEEARTWGPLKHPLIALPYQHGNTDGVVFVAMEYIEGSDLASVINRGRRLPMWLKLSIVMQILEALAYVHSKGIIHRDVKPSNVMLLPDNTIKVIDFGIARAIESVRPMSFGAGTPSYMAPEQQFGPAVDHRADIFAVGAVAYELLTNRRPFQRCEQRPPRPAPLGIEWSAQFPELENIVFKALSATPEDRFESAAAMRSALEKLSADPSFAGALRDETIVIGEAPAPAPAPTPPRRTDERAAKREITPSPRIARVRHLAIPGSLLLVILIVTLVALVLNQRPPADSPSPGSKPPASAAVQQGAQQGAPTPAASTPGSGSIQSGGNSTAASPPPATSPSSQPLPRGGSPRAPASAAYETTLECALGEAGAYVNAVALTPDARYVVTATGDGKLRVWSTTCNAPQRPLSTLSSRDGGAQAVALNSTGTRLAAAWASDTLVRVWNLAAGGGSVPELEPKPEVLEGQPNPVVALAFGSKDQLFSASDRVLQEWNLIEPTGRPFALGAFTGLITSIDSDRGPGLLAAASSAGSIALWNPGSPTPTRVLSGSCRNIRSVAVARSGTVAGGCADGAIVVCRPEGAACEPLSTDGEEATPVAGTGAALTALSFDVTGRWLASGDAKGILTIRNLAGAAVQGSDAHRGTRITALEFSAVGRKLVSSDADGAIRMWDLSQLK